VDGTGSGLCPVLGLVIRYLELFGSAIRDLVVFDKFNNIQFELHIKYIFCCKNTD
jgi:hypothetical protein